MGCPLSIHVGGKVLHMISFPRSRWVQGFLSHEECMCGCMYLVLLCSRGIPRSQKNLFHLAIFYWRGWFQVNQDGSVFLAFGL